MGPHSVASCDVQGRLGTYCNPGSYGILLHKGGKLTLEKVK
jgi:hypothetical protein